ncbi:MAG: hypothetical protein QNJ90_13555 [Planctomycetota bacterium]|nr:hypothetical protein [Planctomycetota bacterium]
MKRRPLLRALAAGLLLLACVAGPASAKEPSAASAIYKAHAKLAQRTAKELAKLFKDARKKGYEAVADGVALQIVHFDAEHAEAHTWLGYERGDDGWTRPETLASHKSTKPKGESTFRSRWTKKTRSLARSFWRMLDKAPEDLDTEARRFVLEDIAALAPDDKRLARERTHEMQDGHWLTLEARKARTTWNDWQEVKKAAFEGVPDATDTALHPRLEPIGNLIWKSRVDVGGVKVWGTCPRLEAETIGQHAHVAARMFSNAFGVEVQLPKDLGFVVVTSRKEVAILAEGLELGGRLRTAPGYELPGTNLIVTGRWQGWPVRRDTAMRFLYSRFYEEHFGYRPNVEWAMQGVSVLFTYMQTSTCYSILGWDDSTQNALDRRLRAVLFTQGADWGAYARDTKNDGNLPTVLQLEPQSRRQIWVTDLLACYIYAYYVSVVHHDKAPAFYRHLAKNGDAAAAVQAIFGWTMDAFEGRISRWLNDYRKYEEGKSRRVAVRGKPPR